MDVVMLVFPHGNDLRYPIDSVRDHGANGVLLRTENIGTGCGADAEIQFAFAGQQSAANIPEKPFLVFRIFVTDAAIRIISSFVMFSSHIEP